MQFGLLGEKLGHSYSPQIHQALGGYPYELYEVSPEDLDRFIKFGTFDGLNVTIPYKKAVIPYCDTLSPAAESLGAVNTILRGENGKLIGHNTDYYGFDTMLRRSGLSVEGKKVLVLGSGGASATVCAVLEDHGARWVVISRTGENNYGNLHRHADAAVIVNATPVGMYPNVGIAPVELDRFPVLEGVLDLIYNPSRSQLLLDAETRGIPAMNGLLMLVAQAKESAEWFTGQKIPDSRIQSVYEAMRRRMENIILIGMPGSGKTTVGTILAEALDRPFVDADQCIMEKAGVSIPEIFQNAGEAGFRALENQVLAQLGRQSGLVIATGGGCVTRQENKPLLHQNGTVFWIQRDLCALPTDGRPLSQGADLAQMYEIRRPMYQQFANHAVYNGGTPEEAAQAILRILEEAP